MNLYQNKTEVLILAHFNYRTDENEDTDSRVANYLKERVKKVVLIAQPFPEYNHRYTYLRVITDGKRIKNSKYYIPVGPSWLQFLYHMLLLYYILLFNTGVNFDLCIAMENLSFISVLPLRFFKKIKRLVYYSIDFVPDRFPNIFLNKVYHFMDKLGFEHSDSAWVMTEEQFTKRVAFGITNSNNLVNIVPIGYDTKKINTYPIEKTDLYNIVYAGALRESTGPELAIRTMPLLIEQHPRIRLTIIGSGKDSEKLQELIKKLDLGKVIDFKGYIANFYDLTEILTTKSIGLAPYKPLPESFSYYSDPSKIKLYMCCGLPVITTNMTTMSGLISKTKSGVITDYSEKSLANAVSFLLGNQKRYAIYKKNATNLAAEFDVNNILKSAISKIPIK